MTIVGCLLLDRCRSSARPFAPLLTGRDGAPPKSFWKNYVVKLQVPHYRCEFEPIFCGTVEEVAAVFQALIFEQMGRDYSLCSRSPSVIRLRPKWSKDKGCELEIKAWQPRACQGRGWPEFTLSFRELQIEPSPDPEMTFWRRSKTCFPGDAMSIAKGFDALFYIIRVSSLNNLDIQPSSHELAAQILYWHFVSSPKMTSLEFEFENHTEKRIVSNLCSKFIRNSPYLERVRFPSLNEYDKYQIRAIFESVECSPSLQILQLPNTRCVNSSSEAPPISLTPLVHSFKHKKNGLKELKISRINLCSKSVVELVAILPEIGLENLILRNTSLNETAMLSLSRAVKNDKTIKQLDISDNTVTQAVLTELCASLQENLVLERLAMKHCGITCDHIIASLAASLSRFCGLRHLHLDGNEFTWEPLVEGSWNGAEIAWKGGVSKGADMMVNRLEENHTLLSLKMGEHNEVVTHFGFNCCSPLPYFEHLSSQAKEKREQVFSRNRKAAEGLENSRRQQRIVRIAGLLLAKLQEENSATTSSSSKNVQERERRNLIAS